LHARRGGPLLGQGGGVEHEHGVGPADRDGDQTGEHVEERPVVPIDLTDEPLDDLAVEVVAVGDRLGVLPLDVGEQPGEVGAGVAPRAGERSGERHGELLQPAHHPVKEGRGDLTAGEQLLLAALESGLHGRPPSIGSCPLEGIDTKSFVPEQVTPDGRITGLLPLEAVARLAHFADGGEHRLVGKAAGGRVVGPIRVVHALPSRISRCLRPTSAQLSRSAIITSPRVTQ
jgi:hypothetical protein